MTKEIGNSELIDTWAASGAKQEPDLSKKNAGWLSGERPVFQFFNWLLNLFGIKINHILQNGIPLWNAGTAYVIGNVVNYNSVIYTAIANHTNSAPPSANWKISNSVKDKYDATTAPTASNDSSQGYALGSRWYDAVGNEVYVLVNATVGAAVWLKTTLTIDELGVLATQSANLTIGLNEKISTVASATTPDIWTGTGNVINYTGTTTTTGFAAAPQAGARRTLICAGAVQFTNGANMIIDGGANFTASAGDRVHVIAVTTTQFRLEIVKADGTAVVAPSVNIGASYFHGNRTAGNVSATNDFICNNALVNFGSNYNTTTGIYTAPATGLYLVSWSAMMNGGVMALYKNGSSYDTAEFGDGDDNIMGSKTLMLFLTSGDTLKLVVTSGTAQAASAQKNNLFISRMT